MQLVSARLPEYIGTFCATITVLILALVKSAGIRSVRVGEGMNGMCEKLVGWMLGFRISYFGWFGSWSWALW